MPNATRRLCDFPGCKSGPVDDDGNPSPYITPPDLPEKEDVSATLKEHVTMAHELPLRMAESKVNQLKAEADKLRAEAEKLAAE